MFVRDPPRGEKVGRLDADGGSVGARATCGSREGQRASQARGETGRTFEMISVHPSARSVCSRGTASAKRRPERERARLTDEGERRTLRPALASFLDDRLENELAELLDVAASYRVDDHVHLGDKMAPAVGIGGFRKARYNCGLRISKRSKRF